MNEALWLQDIEHPTRDKKQGARLILAYSPERAKKDKKDRERLLAKLEKKISKKNAGPKDFISNSGVKKYVSVNGGVAVLNKEAAFRVSKHDLSTRPIFHWTPDRIHSHVLICFLSLVLERHLEVMLKQRNTPVATTQIHDALGRCKKIIFQDNKSNRLFEMDSNKPIEAKNIYEAVGLRWRHATRELENPGGNVVPSSVSVRPQMSGIDPI